MWRRHGTRRPIGICNSTVTSSMHRMNWSYMGTICKKDTTDFASGCTEASQIWRARAPVICFEIVELHLPDRVLCQFGLMHHHTRCPWLSQPIDVQDESGSSQQRRGAEEENKARPSQPALAHGRGRGRGRGWGRVPRALSYLRWYFVIRVLIFVIRVVILSYCCMTGDICDVWMILSGLDDIFVVYYDNFEWFG